MFKEIELAYNNKPSIFDNFTSEDLLLAFFPCIRFENQIKLWFRGDCKSQKKWDFVRKLEYNLKIHKELSNLYELITKFAIICYKRNLKCIIENPYSSQHYLTNYWSLKPKVIDENRKIMGDYWKKPTQYWFINLEPNNNDFEHYEEKETIKTLARTNPRNRKKYNAPRLCKKFY